MFLFRRKWHIPKEVFSQPTYPQYISGFTTLFTTWTAVEMYDSACKRPLKWLQKFWIDDVAFYGIFAKENNQTLIHSHQFAMDSTHCRVPCLAWHHHPRADRSLGSQNLADTLFKEMHGINCTICETKRQEKLRPSNQSVTTSL